jgi:hypothetical protein
MDCPTALAKGPAVVPTLINTHVGSTGAHVLGLYPVSAWARATSSSRISQEATGPTHSGLSQRT